MKLRFIIVFLFLATPYLGISFQGESSTKRNTPTYSNLDEQPIGLYGFIDHDIPVDTDGPTFLSKNDSKGINTAFRLIITDINGVVSPIVLTKDPDGIPRSSANFNFFIDRFLRSSISPQAP